MPNENYRIVHLGDASLTREEAIRKALQITVSNLTSDQQPDLESVKTFVLHEGPIVTKVARFWDIRSSTGEVRHSSFKFETLRRTKERGWELELHHSFSSSDKSDAEAVEKPQMIFPSMNSLNEIGNFIMFDSEGIDLEKLSEVLKIVSKTGKQSEFFSKFLEWIQVDPQAQLLLTQLLSDDQHISQSLFAALNFRRYRKSLTRFQEMVEENLPEQDYQKFLEENYWLFGSEYSELLEERILVRGQQLDFPLRRTVDGYLEVIEIKRPLGRRSGFSQDGSHNPLYPRAEIYRSVSQVLSYLSALKADNYRILKENRIDVTGVRGKVVIGRDGSDEEEEARKLFNDDSRSVEVMSFDSLIRMGERVLDIMVNENPDLREMHSPREDIGDPDVREIPR